MIRLNFTENQKAFVISAIAVTVCMGFVLGYVACIIINHPRERVVTWGELISVMPTKIKEDIAIDYCVAHHSMCKNLPLSSPIAPMDGKPPSLTDSRIE